MKELFTGSPQKDNTACSVMMDAPLGNPKVTFQTFEGKRDLL